MRLNRKSAWLFAAIPSMSSLILANAAAIFILLPPSGRISGRVVQVGMIGWRISLFALIILALTTYWLLSFFGQSILPGLPHTEGFIDMLSVFIVVLILIRFLE